MIEKFIYITLTCIGVVTVVSVYSELETGRQLAHIQQTVAATCGAQETATAGDLVPPENVRVLDYPIDPPTCWIAENGIDMVCSDPSCYVEGLEQHCIYHADGWSVTRKGL